jgi:CBS domain-containing protein
MGSNLIWCKSLTDWIKQYDNWMNTQVVMKLVVFSLIMKLLLVNKNWRCSYKCCFKNAKNNSLFSIFLGNDALEKIHHWVFKILMLKMMDLIKINLTLKPERCCHLWWCQIYLYLRNSRNKPFQRFKQFAMLDPKHSEVLFKCAEAF